MTDVVIPDEKAKRYAQVLREVVANNYHSGNLIKMEALANLLDPPAPSLRDEVAVLARNRRLAALSQSEQALSDDRHADVILAVVRRHVEALVSRYEGHSVADDYRDEVLALLGGEVTVRPLCADQFRRCSCPCGCPNTNAEPGIPACLSCIDNCDLSDDSPSLGDEVLDILEDGESRPHHYVRDDILAAACRHIMAIPNGQVEPDALRGWVWARSEILRMLGQDDPPHCCVDYECPLTRFPPDGRHCGCPSDGPFEMGCPCKVAGARKRDGTLTEIGEM